MEKKLPVALFIGRFQPFHKGHLSAVKWIAKRSRKVIVAIGSAQEKGTPSNPFSAQERMKMVRSQLSAAGLLRKCVLVPVTDVNSNERWAAHVDSSVPEYDVAYSNNALVKRLMRRAGKKALAVPFFRKRVFNATRIRGRMGRKMRWEDRVPDRVRKALKGMNAEERIRKLRS